jgi:hypothetical protein
LATFGDKVIPDKTLTLVERWKKPEFGWERWVNRLYAHYNPQGFDKKKYRFDFFCEELFHKRCKTTLQKTQ